MVLRDRVLAGAALAGVLGTAVWLAAPTGRVADADSPLSAALPRASQAGSSPLLPRDAGARGGEASAPAGQRLPNPLQPRATGAMPAVAITVTATPTLLIGETGELALALAPNDSIADIGFTVQFDANVLQVRAGQEGEWASRAGVNASFTADIAGTEDRVQVRSVLPGRRLRGAGGNVAVLQFQAVAPGFTSVVVSDVTARDLAGNAVRFTLPASVLQVVAESLPQPSSVKR